MTIVTQQPEQPLVTAEHFEANPQSCINLELVSSEFLQLIPQDFAREHLILSQGSSGDIELIAVTESTNRCAIFNIGVCLGREIKTVTMDGEVIASAIDAAYGNILTNKVENGLASDAIAGETDSNTIDQLIAEANKDLLSTKGKAPVIRLVDALLFDALSRRASDIHLQPLPRTTLVRYRLDGVLHTVREISTAITNTVVSRIKVMGRMDIAERRMPQDGRASVTIGAIESGAGRAINLRISSIPTSYGERIVIRLLDNTQQLCDLNQIGMPPDIVESYIERATRSNGIILVTGPTGSGKTTTLYSTLIKIGSAATNIMTIEDPIEYELSSIGDGLAISQSQINPKKGVTFSTGLRHILRQDPDIVMVGEIRDAETARIAIQSSLTGHVVFSTLHTNDAASAVTRLIDLGIEPYLVSASLSAVLAQRLVRKVHTGCSGEGCDDCFGTGFLGRTGLFEILVIDEKFRELITTNSSLAAIREEAARNGVRTLLDEGRRLVGLGLTTQSEVDRVVMGVLQP